MPLTDRTQSQSRVPVHPRLSNVNGRPSVGIRSTVVRSLAVAATTAATVAVASAIIDTTSRPHYLYRQLRHGYVVINRETRKKTRDFLAPVFWPWLNTSHRSIIIQIGKDQFYAITDKDPIRGLRSQRARRPSCSALVLRQRPWAPIHCQCLDHSRYGNSAFFES